MPRPTFRLLLVGGQSHRSPTLCPLALVESIASSRHGGNGAIRRALAKIQAGGVDGVVIRSDFIGHSACNSLRKACKKCGLIVTLVSGGRTRAQWALEGVVRRLDG